MPEAFHQVRIERRGPVCCVWLKRRRLNEPDLQELGDELMQLVAENGCRLMALSLGNDQLDCLYSAFIGKIIAVRKLLVEKGGHIHLCEVGPLSLDVLKYTRLTELLEIHPDMEAAIKALQAAG
jgi:hypothetical protein